MADAGRVLEPDMKTGIVERCATKIVLAEFGIYPFRMALPVIEDDTRDGKIELRRGYVDTPANDSSEEDEAA
ncbi:hypothetical protein [Hansschlegelia plantiphila]|uniref:Uncharacterized protein n=1 Tax=Hansschlegelia plantiphila TaxID=374655 RepID=A0A9W6IZH2_9HYPH|nr:hypothetical protein [Hansschlegelia plantiphila]GLK68026.1 hypothetical protein GCM10008179_16640 [Hansschlegelia plantiphila]